MIVIMNILIMLTVLAIVQCAFTVIKVNEAGVACLIFRWWHYC